MEKDEEKILSRKRLEKWIKIFLAFLAFAWLCTIISKSIYVSGLTRVKTETASKKYVEHIVETDGIVITGGEIAVNTQSGLRVDRIYVRQGDTVKEGDVLFTIDLADISNQISEKETELARKQYDLSDIQTNAVIDSQKREAALLWAQEDYDTADYETSVAKERAKEALDKAETELAEHLANPVPYTSDSARQDAWDTYHDWVNRGYGISDKITEKERELQDLQEQLAELEQAAAYNIDGNVLYGAVGDEEGEAPETGTDNTDSTDNSTDTDENIDSGSKEDNDDTDQNDAEPNDTEPDSENDADTDKENGTNQADESGTDPDGEEDTASDPKDDSNTDDQNSIVPEDTAGSSQDPELNAKKLELQNRIKKVKEELLALQDDLTRHGRESVKQPDYSAEEQKYDAWQSTRLTLEANVQHARENYSDVSYAREVTLRQKLREIVNAQVTTRVDSTAAIYELDMKQTQAQLASLYAIQKQNGEVRAQSDGVISAIRVETGGRTSDMAAVLMTDGQRPCQFKFSITKEQGKYVHLNDMVRLKLNGQSSDMEITVDYFTENAQGGYDAICMLPEGVGQPGLSGSVQKTVQGEYHDLALPADAVYEDNGGGYYIFTLNEKEGILGSEYYVEKIKVQVKDRNDRYAALEPGTISADTKVIVYATKELKQGESVRPNES